MSASERHYAQANDEDLAPLTALLAQALHFRPEAMQRWLERVGTANLRVIRRQGRVVGGLGIIPMRQWFGGRRVPVAAITAVGVAPEQRGRGVGGQLMRGLLDELRAGGTPLSVLYPSTLSFYRAVGYERAGTRISYGLPIATITRRDDPLEIEPVEVGDYAPLLPLYQQMAERTPGMFDRAPFIWHTIIAPVEGEARSYLITSAGQPAGYLTLSQAGRHEPLRIRDLVLLSRAAGQRALTFLADHRVFIDQVSWVGSPDDPLVALLPEQRYTVLGTFDWVLRIVDLVGALVGRGYPRSLQAELHLDVHDDLLGHNRGPWQIMIAGGQATVQPGGAGRVRLGIRELAALYSGHLTPATLQFSGALDGPADDLALLALVFSGPPPRLTDPF